MQGNIPVVWNILPSIPTNPSMTGYRHPHFDLYNFAARIQANTVEFDFDIRYKADILMDAIGTCILASYAGRYYNAKTLNGQFTPLRNGLAFFFPDGNGISHIEGKKYYDFQWGYTHLDTNVWRAGHYYGKLDFCYSNSNSNSVVETWRELLEFWFDNDGDDSKVDTPGSW